MATTRNIQFPETEKLRISEFDRVVSQLNEISRLLTSSKFRKLTQTEYEDLRDIHYDLLNQLYLEPGNAWAKELYVEL